MRVRRHDIRPACRWPLPNSPPEPAGVLTVVNSRASAGPLKGQCACQSSALGVFCSRESGEAMADANWHAADGRFVRPRETRAR